MAAPLVIALLIVAVFVSTPPAASATSNGDGVYLCDPRLDGVFGCDPDRYVEGDRLRCRDRRIMSWATRPVTHAAYALFKAPTPDPDLAEATYTPGQLNRIHLAVLEEGMQFRGILLQARDASDQLAGEWDIGEAQPASVHHARLCPGSLLHATADRKPYRNTFLFRAPPAGTGPLSFHALLKYGEANEGAFYRPPALALQEAAAAPSTRWVRTEGQENCHAACQRVGDACDADALLAEEASPLSFLEGAAADQPCPMPLISHCGPSGPGLGEDGLCYFQDAAHCAEQRVSLGATCGAAPGPAMASRLCPCKPPEPTQSPSESPTRGPSKSPSRSPSKSPTRSPTSRPTGAPISLAPTAAPVVPPPSATPTANPSAAPVVPSPSAAPTAKPTAAPVVDDAVAEVVWFGDNGPPEPTEPKHTASSKEASANASSRAARAPVLLGLVQLLSQQRHVKHAVAMALLALAPSVSAHNWIESMSRAFRASTTLPCPQRQGRLPHVQVGPGQEFEIEWSTGHSDRAYFVTVRAEDEARLIELSAADLAEYVASCPSRSEFMDEGGNRRFRKFHRKNDPGTDLGTRSKANLFHSVMEPGDPDYTPRHEAFIANSARVPEHRSAGEAAVAVRYRDSDVSNDVRCAYTNPKWPFVIEVSAFEVVAGEPRLSVDAARFRIGGSHHAGANVDPGEYIVWYHWRGYSDCVDVQVVDSEVAEPYGVAREGLDFTKVEHCRLRAATVLENRCVEVVDDVEMCKAVCERFADKKAHKRCRGVQIAPVALPRTAAFPGYMLAPLTNTPLTDENGNELPWCRGTVGEMDWVGPERLSRSEREKQLVCFAVTTPEPTETLGVMDVSADPHDPVFYGTCLLAAQGRREFQRPTPGGQQLPSPASAWRKQGGCLPCDQTAALAAQPEGIWAWNPATTTCVNCDLEPVHLDASARRAIVREQPVVDWNNRQPLGANELPWDKRGSGQRCKPGLHSCTNPDPDRCMRQLTPAGSRLWGDGPARVQAETCYKLAKRDSYCTDMVFYNAQDGVCWCWRNNNCCGDCQLQDDDPNLDRFRM